jgi:hypothetical protein
MCGGGGGYTEKEPESKLALAQQAANALKRYGKVFVPLENAFIQDSLNSFGEDAYGDVMGQTSTGIAKMYEDKMPSYTNQIFAGGIDPTSGAYAGKTDSIMAAKARSMGEGAANAGIRQTDNAYAGLQNVVKAGQGLQTDTMQGNVSRMNDQLVLAGTQAEADFAKNSLASEIAGTVAGVGSGIYANQGNKV